jgi:3-oxoacyl-[acyl-carrier protein] reductase
MGDTPPGKVAIVTGASRGIGREIALAFGRSGCRVVVNFHAGKGAADAVADAVNRSGGEAFQWKADVRASDDVSAMIAETVRRWGRIDVLVNNAGIAKDGLVLRMTEQSWDEVVGTNLTGAFHCIRSAAKIMSKNRGGHIINVSSIAGIQGRKGQANYSASKAGLIGLTKACAKELGRFNIAVNAVLPGYQFTKMGESASGAAHETILQENALGRTSTLSEIARFVYALTLTDNVSGQTFNLDSRVF